jgi:hypothetical protein
MIPSGICNSYLAGSAIANLIHVLFLLVLHCMPNSPSHYPAHARRCKRLPVRSYAGEMPIFATSRRFILSTGGLQYYVN